MNKSRIELHLKSSYDYLDKESMITPEDLISYLKTHEIKAVGVVDYLSALTIPTLLNLKKENNLQTKFIFGISINIKYDDVYVPSILLAKNTKGLKKLYEIITHANKSEKRFLTSKELQEYHTDLIYGISKFDLAKNYQEVIKYYEYIEIDPDDNPKINLEIEQYALNNNLLLISSNKPNTLNKANTGIYGIKREYLKTEEMLNKLNYLKNPYDVVINNAYKLIEKITDYELPKKEIHLFKYDKCDLSQEVYDRASLLYLDDIPINIQTQIEKELKIINKYHLADTILLLEDLIKKARRNSYANLGGYLSNTLIAYILGLTEINMLNLKNKRNLEKDILKYGYNFRINTDETEIPILQDYLRRLTNQKDIYFKGTYRTMSNVSENNHLNFKEIYLEMGIIPGTCYVIPKDINILDYTPLNYLNNKLVTCFDFNYLDSFFASIYFATSTNFDLLNLLEEKCLIYVEDIPLNLPEVVKETYEFVDNYEPQKFILNNYMPELRMKKKVEKPQTLEELISIENLTNANFQSKVISYYYLNYYKVKYPHEFYAIYFKYIFDFFRIDKISTEINSKNNEKLEVIELILKRMKKLKISNTTDNKNINDLTKNIWQNKITLINYESESSTNLIINLLSLLCIKKQYKTHLYALHFRSEFYNRHLISFLSGIDNKVLIKYFYPYLGVSKNYSDQIDKIKFIETLELIQKSPLYMSSTKAYKSKDYLSYILLDSNEEIAFIDDLNCLIKEENLSVQELIKNIKDNQASKKVVIISRKLSPKELLKYQTLGVNVINVLPKNKTYHFTILNTNNNLLLSTSFGKEDMLK